MLLLLVCAYEELHQTHLLYVLTLTQRTEAHSLNVANHKTIHIYKTVKDPHFLKILMKAFHLHFTSEGIEESFITLCLLYVGLNTIDICTEGMCVWRPG